MTATETITGENTTDTTPPDPTGNGDSDTLDTGQGDSEGRKMPREQRYRLERNQAREALTAAEARITAYQIREVERLASELAQPGDLLELGELGLSEYLTEDGNVDPDAVADAVAALIEARPGLARRPVVGATDPSQGMGGGRGRPPAPSWEGFLRTG